VKISAYLQSQVEDLIAGDRNRMWWRSRTFFGLATIAQELPAPDLTIRLFDYFIYFFRMELIP